MRVTDCRKVRDFIILANSHWDSGGGGDSSQQYARAISKKGDRYIFIGPTEIKHAYEIMDKKGVFFDEKIILCELPTKDFLDVSRLLKERGACLIYRIVDNWAHMPENEWYDIEVETELVKLSDISYAASYSLKEKFEKVRKDIRVLKNAVDLEVFNQKVLEKPLDLREGAITIGFWGSFWCDWFDWALIRDVSIKRPEWSFNLIGGDIEKLRLKAGDMPSNINLIGRKSWHELYKYLYYFDVCILPYVSKEGSRQANPMKALEYLSGYKEVVSYKNDSLLDVPYIRFYENEAGFIKGIENAKRDPVDKKIIDGFLEKNTWASRLNEIERGIEDIEKN